MSNQHIEIRKQAMDKRNKLIAKSALWLAEAKKAIQEIDRLRVKSEKIGD